MPKFKRILDYDPRRWAHEPCAQCGREDRPKLEEIGTRGRKNPDATFRAVCPKCQNAAPAATDRIGRVARYYARGFWNKSQRSKRQEPKSPSESEGQRLMQQNQNFDPRPQFQPQQQFQQFQQQVQPPAQPQMGMPQGQVPDPYAKAGQVEIGAQGQKLQPGVYWLVIDTYFRRISKNAGAGTEGMPFGILEARVLRNLSPADQSGRPAGTQVGSKVGISKSMSQSQAFYLTFSPIVAALAGIDDPNDVDGKYFHCLENTPAVAQFSIVEARVSEKVSNAGRSYLAYDDVRLVADEEALRWTAMNENAAAAALPQGMRSQIGLPPAPEAFKQALGLA